jgi:hypothetical protein
MCSWLVGPHAWGGLAQGRAVLLAFAFFLSWSVVAYAALRGERYAGPAFAESISSLVLWFAAFFMGTFFRLEGAARRWLFTAAVLAAFAVLPLAMLERGSPLGPLMVFGAEIEADQQSSSYQGVGRSLLVASMLATAATHVYWRQLLGLASTTALLVTLGSRAHLFTAASLTFLVLGVALLRSRRRGAPLLFLVLAAGALAASWSLFLETRAGEILDLSTSTSWAMRLEVQTIALREIAAHPLLGDFGYHLREIGPGGYAHNALSAWPQYGLVGFVLYGGLIVYFLALSLRRVVFAPSTSAQWRAALFANFAALVLVVSSEPVFTVMPALAWGLTVNALLQDRDRRTSVRYAG